MVRMSYCRDKQGGGLENENVIDKMDSGDMMR